MNYVNLKVHSDHSLLEGVGKISQYIERAKELGQSHIGFSDTEISSLLPAYIEANKNNITPILGLELFTYGLKSEGEYSINAYAKNYKGYKELIELYKISKQNTNIKRNILNIQDIIKNSSNLAILIGGINSEIHKSFNNLDYADIREIISFFKKNFNDVYVEVPCFNFDKKDFMFEYIDILKNADVKYILTSDVYYVYKQDFYLQKILTAIKQDKKINSLEKYYKQTDLYLKSNEDILPYTKDFDEEFLKNCEYNLKIFLENINLKIEKSNDLPEIIKENEQEHLKKLCFDFLLKKELLNETYKKRLEYELSVINKMGFNRYFLIVLDIINFAKKENILYGPGRGSSAGSLVSYCLGITNVDPIKNGLYFERFLNEGRKTMPDIDLDFESLKRHLIVEYLADKYGNNNVAHILTFSNFKEKQLEKDLNKVFGKTKYDKEQIIKKLSGNIRHHSIHASGIIISSKDINDIACVNYDAVRNISVVQSSMEELSYMGLIKFDILSVSMFDIIKQTLDLINLKLEDIKFDDKKTFDLYNKGQTAAIFQVEANNMTRFIKQFKINKLEDLSLALAIFRPGPLNSIKEIKNIKNNKPNYEFEKLKEILDPSYGIIIYQEQIMEIAKSIAGFSLSEADDLRRAISKKNENIFKEYEEKFIQNCIKNGYDKELSLKLYHKLEKFAQYGFNKSHSISYAMVSYYSAYLKANYMKEYMMVNLNNNINDISKMNQLIFEMFLNDIQILKPCVNNSDKYFKIEDNKIRYGLYAIKNLPKELANNIISQREKINFSDINNFCTRLINHGLNEENFKILASSGALNCFNISIKELVENAKEIINNAKNLLEQEENIGARLFFADSEKILPYFKKNIEEYKEKELLKEKIKFTAFFYHNDIIKLLDLTNIDIFFAIDNKKENILNFNNLKNPIKNDLDLNVNCEYIIKHSNKYSLLKDVKNIKNTSIFLLLDNLTLEQKENLKAFLKNKGGNCLIQFYENKKLLKTDKKMYFNPSFENLTNLSEIINFKNIKLVIT